MEEIVRRPLVPSEKTNASAAAHSSVLPNVRKLRAGEVVRSRYSFGAGTGTTGMIGGTGSGNAVRRHPSPVSTRTGSGTGASMMVMPKRAQSAERRRPCATTPSLRSSAPSSPSAKNPAASRAASPSRHSTTTAPGMHDSLVSAEARLQFSSQRAPEVLWPSMRSMSSSFQSEIISIPISKKDWKSSSSSSPLNISTERERKRTPLRGRSTATDPLENNTHHNSRPSAAIVDQHRWARTTTTGPKIAGSPTALSSRGVISPRKAPINIGIRSDTETPLSLARSSRSMSLPSSPNKASSPTSGSSRGMGSPFRTRPSTPFSPTSPSSSSPSSAHGTISDYRRLKKNPNHLEDSHQLRISHARYLQWRFVNARTEDSSSFQKLTMEDELCNTWTSITDLHNSVATLKIHIQRLKQELKLNLILEEQMAYLHVYSLLENIHLDSLSSAIAALQARTMRLPLSGRITANTHTLKNSITSAVDVMQSMGSSIHFFLSKVEDTNSVAFELANLAFEETYMLQECRELLVSTAAMQVQESTLRTHLLQLHNVCQRQSYSYYP